MDQTDGPIANYRWGPSEILVCGGVISTLAGSGESGAVARAGYKSSPQEEHLAHLSSSDTRVVVMEATEYGDCCGRTPLSREAVESAAGARGLGGTRFVVVADVLGDHAPEVILTRMRTCRAPLSGVCRTKRSAKAFMSGRAYRRAHDAHARRLEYGSEREPSFVRGRRRQPVVRGPWWRSSPCCAHHSSVGGIGHRGMEDRSRRRSRKKSTNTSRNRMSNVCTSHTPTSRGFAGTSTSSARLLGVESGACTAESFGLHTRIPS